MLICQRPVKLFFIHRRTEVSLSSGWHVLFRMLYSDTLITKEICGKDVWPMDSIRSWAGYVFKCLPHPPWTRRWHIFLSNDPRYAKNHKVPKQFFQMTQELDMRTGSKCLRVSILIPDVLFFRMFSHTPPCRPQDCILSNSAINHKFPKKS